MADRIFRQYDIRGVYGRDLTLDMAERIGRGYGRYLSRRKPTERRLKVSVGSDVRLSSPPLKEALIRGIASSPVILSRCSLRGLRRPPRKCWKV